MTGSFLRLAVAALLVRAVPALPVETPAAASGNTCPSGEPEAGCHGAASTGSPPQAGSSSSARTWTFLPPGGLLYKSYVAGPREPRFGAVWLYERDVGWIWETALGGRFPMLRFGTVDPVDPEGWQLDLEGAAFPRIDVGTGTDVDAIDFRLGFQLTWRHGKTAVKAGYFHFSSHVGDEFRDRNPDFVRRNYAKESLVAGITRDLTDDISVYGELGYGLSVGGGAEPWELQFGLQYDPAASGWVGAPFAAVNAHLREEFDFGGSFNMLAGWQWRSAESGRTIRSGIQYFNGKALQFEFFDKEEELFGIGVWFDF